MKKGNLILMAVAMGLMLVLAGCSGSDESAETPATEATTQVAQTHDCDGGCGMTAVPMDKLTEINSKYYCAGCVGKAKAEAEGEKADDEHEGHSHG